MITPSAPYTKFVGFVRHVNISSYGDLGQNVFSVAFPDFEGQEDVARSLRSAGVEYIMSARGVSHAARGRERRFAGDNSLERGRYFALCSSFSGANTALNAVSDQGTLINELTAYYSYTGGVDIEITDSQLHTERVAEWTRRGFDLRFVPFIAVSLQSVHVTDKIASIYRDAGKTVGRPVLFMYESPVIRLNLERVIDLRRPDVQEWFTRFFVGLERGSEQAAMDRTGISFSPKGEIDSFKDVVPILVSPELGGAGTFSQAIGAWLRADGADGLIYPSARSNASAEVVNGQVQQHVGWNVVIYSGSASPNWRDRFGLTTSWSDPDLDHIKVDYAAAGNARGTIKVSGSLQYNRLKFQLERQILHGHRDEGTEAFRSIIGLQQEELTRATLRELYGDTEKQ